MDKALELLVNSGPWGLACGLLAYALIKVDGRRNDEIDARLKDALEWQKTVAGNTDAIEKIGEQHREANRVIDAMSKSLDILNATLRRGTQ